MDIKGLRSREQQFLTNDGKVTHDEAEQLDAEVKADGGWSPKLKKELKKIIAEDGAKMDPVARGVLEDAAGVKHSPQSAPLAPTDVLRSFPGADPSDFSNNIVFLGKDGALQSDTGIVPYTRSYDKTQTGPLRMTHGSPAPETTVLKPDELEALRKQTPGQSLDNAAKVFGAPTGVGFENLANDPGNYNPKADYWWGKCHAWSWSSLNKTIDQKVDVNGPEGQRGLWVGGQWMSRADLGDWMMAVADNISVGSPGKIVEKGPDGLPAEDLIKGTSQFLSENGGGVIANIWNTKREGTAEIWNQPMYRADFDVKSVKGAAADAVLAQAEKDGVEFGANVKLVNIVGKYGREIAGGEPGDKYEGDPYHEERNWNMYAVTDATGKMIKAYMADDEKLANIEGLPTKSSDETPDYFWKPSVQAVQDTLDGKTNSVVESSNLAPQFKFFVGTVLKNGVPGQVRTAFEESMKRVPPGPVPQEFLRELVQAYPGVANAYSPEQWQQNFGSRGMNAKDFGAAWPVPNS